MCGIMGIFNGSEPLTSNAFEPTSLDTLRHRGPNSAGWFADDHAFLGFRRLSIIDVDGGDQPLYSTDRQAVLTLNGELYNYRTLRSSLSEDHRFETRSDAEVLVHRYNERGVENLLDGVNGMFAFALFDRNRRRLVLGRDRAGQKPLYWSFKDGFLRWSSELKGLLGDARGPISSQAVGDYLRFGYVPAPLTMFEGIQKLPAGCILVCEGNQPPRVERYWKLEYSREADREVSERDLKLWGERLRDGLTAAVRRRLESEVPMGFLLSGGVDSASVLALGADAMDETVRAFTIGFPNDAVDETQAAAEVARRWSVDHSVFPVAHDEAQDLGRVLYLAEEPLSTDALLPTARVFESVSRAGLTTVLTGEGSDEIMAGYRKFASACSWVEGAKPWPEQGSPLDRYLAFEEFSFQDAADRERLLGETTDDSRFADVEAEAEGLDPLSQMLHFEARLRLPDRINPRLDRLSMAWSIEARAPFMDYELQELCAAMPHRLRRGRRTDKLLLREAVRDLLPKSIIDATKAPFRAPARWFVKQEVMEQELNAEAVEAAGLLEVDAVRKLVKQGGHDHQAREQLYSLYVLHAWHRSFVRCPPKGVTEAIKTSPMMERASKPSTESLAS